MRVNLLSTATMKKAQFYLSRCEDAAANSTMCFKLGACIVKGGKVIATGFNHHRHNYDGCSAARIPSMHAEMSAIFNATGMSPAFKFQAAGRAKGPRSTSCSAEKCGLKPCLSRGDCDTTPTPCYQAPPERDPALRQRPHCGGRLRRDTGPLKHAPQPFACGA